MRVEKDANEETQKAQPRLQSGEELAGDPGPQPLGGPAWEERRAESSKEQQGKSTQLQDS